MSDPFVHGTDRKQRILLPDTLDEYVDENNPARFIDAFVDSLDLVSVGLKHSVPAGTGRPPSNPGDILKLYVYGYLNGLRSSRKPEQEAYRNMQVIWLMKKLRPDHKTIADFRKDNAGALREVFRQFVFFCRELYLFGGELIGVDSTKLRAVNAFEKSITKAVAEKKIREMDGRIDRNIREMEREDGLEERQSSERRKRKGNGGQSLQEKIKHLNEDKEHYSKMRYEMASIGEHEISLTDPDCRTVRCNGSFFAGYNAHAAVDGKNHLIVEYDVTNKTVDADSLFDVDLPPGRCSMLAASTLWLAGDTSQPRK
ncbi:MAG: transposase [Nitrososphaerota archaeon]|nr:transposase [Nitrososphaerota archaeon]